MIYLFTVLDRFTRWPEAIPLPDIRAETICDALLPSWISRFGVPEDITADRGAQFTAATWKELHVNLGIHQKNTTSYHPQCNGLVERFHRQLKASLTVRLTDSSWMTELPIVLLGIRTSWRAELERRFSLRKKASRSRIS